MVLNLVLMTVKVSEFLSEYQLDMKMVFDQVAWTDYAQAEQRDSFWVVDLAGKSDTLWDNSLVDLQVGRLVSAQELQQVALTVDETVLYWVEYLEVELVASKVYDAAALQVAGMAGLRDMQKEQMKAYELVDSKGRHLDNSLVGWKEVMQGCYVAYTMAAVTANWKVVYLVWREKQRKDEKQALYEAAQKESWQVVYQVFGKVALTALTAVDGQVGLLVAALVGEKVVWTGKMPVVSSVVLMDYVMVHMMAMIMVGEMDI